eukprot:scaffold42817_cov50-Phaeocystis_antarctica.AAC.2
MGLQPGPQPGCMGCSLLRVTAHLAVGRGARVVLVCGREEPCRREGLPVTVEVTHLGCKGLHGAVGGWEVGREGAVRSCEGTIRGSPSAHRRPLARGAAKGRRRRPCGVVPRALAHACLLLVEVRVRGRGRVSGQGQG